MVPELVGKLTGLGAEVVVEPDAGRGALIADQEYVEAGATIDPGALDDADVVVSVQPLPTESVRRLEGDGDVLVPPGQPGAAPHRRPARQRHHQLLDGAGAADLARSVDGRAELPGPGLRLPLRDRGRRDAAPLLPPEHDRGRHRPARRGGRPRCRRRRAAGDRDREAPRRGGAGLRRTRRCGRGDPVDGCEGDRARAGDAGGRGWLRAGDDRGPGSAAARAADAVHRERRRPDHDRCGAGSAGADAGHHRDGRADEGRCGGGRPGLGDRRQCRGFGGR